ncbi:MAG TPA: glycoside hydrolase family 5 protein [Polyangiaceae bacterium]|nr:glycoside hydrolase family 5 protein [Polyangiaceae bacterium]
MASFRLCPSYFLLLHLQLLLLATPACAPNETKNQSGGAGQPNTGGATITGGQASSGGKTNFGGNSTGGQSVTGGQGASGGQPTTGGQGGATAGTTSRGGSGGVGGATATAGSAGRAGSGGVGGASDAVDAVAMAKAMGFGTNLGNTFDNTASWETGWGQPLVTQSFIDGIASRGIKTVRVPVAWDTYAKNGVIDAAKLDRVKQVVGWVEAAGMYAIVNIHWDGGWIFNENKANAYRLTADVKTKFASYWKQIGTGFSQVGHKLVLEALNEEARFFVNGDPNGTPDIGALNELNQLFVTTARAQGGYNATRALLIAGFQTDIAKTCVTAFTVPNDPAGKGKLFLSIHYYDPYQFTLMEDPASWGSPSATWGTAAEKKSLEDQFTILGNFSQQKQIPVILGEFAVTKGEKVVRQPSSRVLWMQAVAKASLSRGIVPVLWDTNTDVNRSDGSFSTELQSVMNGLK